MKFLASLIFALGLVACATPPPISSNPIQAAATTVNANFPLGGTVVTGLQNAAYNLDQAIVIMVLPASDPADACVHSALKLIGQDVSSGPVVMAPQFTPKVTDLLSAGSVAYILAQQAKALAGNGGIALPASCEAIVGHLVLTGVNAPANFIISGFVGGLP